MEMTMTLSQPADLLIVTTFVSICVVVLCHVIADLIFLVYKGIKKKWAEHKAKDPDNSGNTTE